MSDETQQLPPPEYWTTLSEYRRDDEYLERLGEEFYPDAKPENFFDAAGDESKFLTPMHRRTFLKLGGFAALAAAVAGCERPVQKIIPYVSKPEEITLGVANYYASTCTRCSAGCGLLVKSREGRPVKLEGNPDHPLNRGALCTRGQASILDLYNPDRLRHPVRPGRQGRMDSDAAARMETLDEEVGRAIARAFGRVVFVGPTIHGPANARLLQELEAAGVEYVPFDPLHPGEVRRSHELSFGGEVTPNYRWDQADTVVCLGGDPLGQSWSAVETQRDFAAKRQPQIERMSRLYVFEPAPTMTGMKADYRYPTHPADLLKVGLAIANALDLDDSQLRELVADYTPERIANETDVSAEEIRRVASSLRESRGRSIIYCHGAAARTGEAMALHLLANYLNHALGNYGATIDISAAPSHQAAGSHDKIARLVEDMRADRVEVLVFHGVNPVYTLPPDLGFKEALGRVSLVVSLNMTMNETAALADIAIPAVHGLESWGDAEPLRGLYSVQQPTIRPIFGPDAANPGYATRSWQESLMAFAEAAGKTVFERTPTDAELEALARQQGLDSVEELEEEDRAPYTITWHDYLRETWRESIYPNANSNEDFERFWIKTLQDGVVDLRSFEGEAPRLRMGALNGVRRPHDRKTTVLVAQQTNVHGDGETMGNPHLLELPDPVSKVSWDNFIAVAPALAERLRVNDGDHVTLTAEGKEFTGPVCIQPGQHPEVAVVNLGWGRNMFGAIGDGIGIDIHPALSTSAERNPVASGIPVTVARGSGRTPLANIQGHNYLYSPTHAGVMVNRRKDAPEGATRNHRGDAVYERPIIGETTLNEWKNNAYAGYPNSTPHGEKPPSMWEGQHKYVGHHWGMTVDLNACIGCNACMVACHIENNVPVVGKEEIIRGREMFWIRIDRYYRGDKDFPDFALQPLMCQHCDHAPCETVCPVVATLHNSEGLNVMVYNRCVGTRYCLNNCPYKVRRFNFWQYSDYRTGPHEGKKLVAPLELVLNPDVTTRSRGVMEKCTFCIQRIRTAKDEARMEGRQLQDGDMVTACQQTCPTKALTFGDQNDPNSELARLWKNPRAYGLLEDMNTDPSVRYLTMVRNRDEPSPYRTKYQSLREDKHHAEQEV